MSNAVIQSYGLATLRIVTALLFMQHGTEKMFHFPGPGHHPGVFELFSIVGLGAVLELFGGLLILIGLFTRPIAFILSGQMAVAYWFFHFAAGLKMPNGMFPSVNQGDLAILFCFVFLYFSIAGPGAWSVDDARTRRKEPEAPPR